ncbi:type III-B CRISPR module RAMP protein Cmr6 [Suttonella ornithocola]|uniref:CRISPR type III-B/RAMP module RAMP protein Cmr6 n=1 Tax=Suttonella ornithocola TaxID=279832 RepID=A0A380MS93_9GAMM|nr:type III-B CRISPR module RAMP protein Cmr6 [Suttonella ornithocola]SUO95044.1 CRISPR type III-B/RAMP module RAMP protein Cmr6 [Suttonella ornithocola]
MPLVRHAIEPFVQNAYETSSAHAGLMVQRGLIVWEEGKKSKKKRHLDSICAIKPDDLYLLAFQRWQEATLSEHHSTWCAKIEGKLMMGLELGGALETGMITQHSYGMPMIPGSSIKGVVRHYADRIGLDKKITTILFGNDENIEGIEAGAGCLIWHDAWWIPNKTQSPFVRDVVSVHHQKYYSGDKKLATDTENPIPNDQLAVSGSFYFVIEGEPKWANFAKELLKQALQTQGIGGKTAAGYGFFAEDKEVEAKLASEKERKLRQQSMAGLSTFQIEIEDFKKELDSNRKSWVDNPSDGKFSGYYNKVMQWQDASADDYRYAYEQLFDHDNYGTKWKGTKLSKAKGKKGKVGWIEKMLAIKAKFEK